MREDITLDDESCKLPATVANGSGISIISSTAATVTTATASAIAAATIATSAAAATVANHLLKLGINILLSLGEHVNEITRLLGIVSGEQGDGGTSLASTAGSADTVDVVLRVVGVVIVEHMSNVAHILCKGMVSNRSMMGVATFQLERIQDECLKYISLLYPFGIVYFAP